MPEASIQFPHSHETDMADSDKRMEDLEPHDRRGFFRAGFAGILRPIAQYVEKKLPIALPVMRTHLRPPGAQPEVTFLDTCFRCGSCADSCPADAISLMQSLDERLRGTPYVDPDRQACVICDELACMKSCPSGALRLVDRLDIRMGLAEVNHDLCLRSKGEDCRICIERCPIADTAIQLDESGRVRVISPSPTGHGCTGCGVCQQHCPTQPVRAIRVEAN